MKLGFEESQLPYIGGTQKARAWTEAWVSAEAYCPHCGNDKMAQFPNNSPLADFLCKSCNEEFELKSQKGKFGTSVADGAYKTKCERLAANNNPNLLLMNYDAFRRQSAHRAKAFLHSRYHRGTKAASRHRATRRLDRVENSAGSRSRVWQDSHREERRRSAEGFGSGRMAENTLSQE
jgi:hypothetical protein